MTKTYSFQAEARAFEFGKLELSIKNEKDISKLVDLNVLREPTHKIYVRLSKDIPDEFAEKITLGETSLFKCDVNAYDFRKFHQGKLTRFRGNNLIVVSVEACDEA